MVEFWSASDFDPDPVPDRLRSAGFRSPKEKESRFLTVLVFVSSLASSLVYELGFSFESALRFPSR